MITHDVNHKLMTGMEEMALNHAIQAHKGQTRDDGSTYVNHLIQTAAIISIIKPDDEELIIAALLHDVIEDTEYTYDDIKMKFSSRVADLVNEVTQEGEKDKHGYYFPRLKTLDGYLLKFADRLSNLNDMNEWPEKRITQYMHKSIFWKTEGPNDNNK